MSERTYGKSLWTLAEIELACFKETYSKDLAAHIRELQAENAKLKADLAQWEKLKDPNALHVNLLRGLPAKLETSQLLHILGDAYQDQLKAERREFLMRVAALVAQKFNHNSPVHEIHYAAIVEQELNK